MKWSMIMVSICSNRAIVKGVIKNDLEKTSIYLFVLDDLGKNVWCQLEPDEGGRILILSFFCHFGRPVSSILNFIAQKLRGGRKCRI